MSDTMNEMLFQMKKFMKDIAERDTQILAAREREAIALERIAIAIETVISSTQKS